MKKWIIFIIILLLLLVFLFFYLRSRNPKVVIKKVKWETGDYEFKITADGKVFEGYKNKSETILPYQDKKGNYIYYAGPVPGNYGTSAVVAIVNNLGQTVTATEVDFISKTIRPYDGKIPVTLKVV